MIFKEDKVSRLEQGFAVKYLPNFEKEW